MLQLHYYPWLILHSRWGSLGIHSLIILHACSCVTVVEIINFDSNWVAKLYLKNGLLLKKFFGVIKRNSLTLGIRLPSSYQSLILYVIEKEALCTGYDLFCYILQWRESYNSSATLMTLPAKWGNLCIHSLLSSVCGVISKTVFSSLLKQ